MERAALQGHRVTKVPRDTKDLVEDKVHREMTDPKEHKDR